MSNSRPLKATCHLLTIALLAALVIGCGEDTDDTTPVDNNATTTGEPQGLRIFNGLAQPSAIDVVLLDEADQQIRIDGVSGASASSYQSLPAGLYRATFFEAGTSTVINVNLIADIAISETSLVTLTVADDESDSARAQLLEDAIERPGENQSRYRLVFLGQSPDVDIVDVATSMRVGDGLGFGQLTPYTQVSVGTYDFEVRKQADSSILLQVGAIPLRPAEVSTLFFVGDADPNGDGDESDSTIDFTHIIDHKF